MLKGVTKKKKVIAPGELAGQRASDAASEQVSNLRLSDLASAGRASAAQAGRGGGGPELGDAAARVGGK